MTTMNFFSPASLRNRLVAALLLPCHLGLVLADTVGVGGLTANGREAEAFVPDFVPPPPLPAPLPALMPPVPAAQEAQLTVADLPQTPASLEELRRVPVFENPLCIPDTSAAWDVDLAAAMSALLRAFALAGSDSEAAVLLADFAAAHPGSPFLMNVHLQRALVLWRQGRFVPAREAYAAAWAAGRSAVSEEGRALAELVLGSLLFLEGRLGRAAELKALLVEAEARGVSAGGKAAVDRARELLWYLENKAEQNVFCGFTALNAVCVPLGMPPVFPDVHDEAERLHFIQEGVSAHELQEHAAEAGGAVRVVRRTQASAAAPTPSVVHWAFGHFSAISERDTQGRVRVVDEHLKFDGWMEPAVLNEQASGVFLIPANLPVPAGYEEADTPASAAAKGRHCTHARDLEDAARASAGGNAADCAMATHSFTLLDAGLTIQDTPVRYAPPRGYPTVFRMVYDQRHTNGSSALRVFDPTAHNSSHLGPRWTHAYMGYVYRASATNNSLSLVNSQGEVMNFTYNTTLQRFTSTQIGYPEVLELAVGSGGPGYRVMQLDGSSMTFTLGNTTSSPTRWFLTSMTDVWGNTTTLQYDASRRLTGIVDALGQTTVLEYAGSARQIKTVTDPFGRQAVLTYSSTSDTGRLLSITDPMNIVSTFEYDASGFPTSLTTPYGKTSFRTGTVPQPSGNAPSYFIESTDPSGDRERAEAGDLSKLPFTDVALAPTTVNVGGADVSFMPRNGDLQWRNSFLWDKKQMHDGHGPDYTKARVYNWLARGDSVVGIPASIKEPLQGRTWFNYPGQVSESAPGTHPMPSKTVRQVEGTDGNPAWVMSQAKYDNPYGLPTGSIDEKGRETRTTYHANNLDVHLVQVKDGATWRTLQSYDSYENRAPTQITDASGVVTTIDYNLQGQVLSTSVSKAGSPTLTTRYTYSDDVNSDTETDGYLIKVQQTDPANASAWVQMAAYTYETVGNGARRVKTATDERGYTVTYTSYDHFDRPLVVTHPDNTTEQFVYNRLELEATKARDGTWSRARYNHLRQLVLSQDSLGRTTSYDWCRCGQLKSITDPLNRTTRYVRDIQGRVLEKWLPDNSKFLYSYQPQSGRLANMRTPKDAAAAPPTVTYKYDLDGRLLTQDYTATNTPDVSFAFADYLGRLTSHTDQLGTTNYAYHPLDGSTPGAGELASVNGPWADDTVFYDFDAYDRPKKQEIRNDAAPNAATHSVEIAHDALDRVSSIVNPLGTFNYAYNDVSDRVQSISTTAGGGFTQTFGYHPLTTPGAGGDMSSMTHQVGSTTVSAFGYGFDAGSRLRTLTEQLGPNPTTDTRQWAYDYTNEDELTDAVLTQPPGGSVQQRRSWQHDAAGNRARESIGNTSKLAWHNTRNQITQIGGGGQSLVEGTLDELGTVTVKVNSGSHQPARMTSLPGGGARFQKEAEFQVGSNTIEVQATDTNNNTTTENYTVEVDAVSDTFLHDTNGNLETHTSGGVTKRYEWDAKNRLLAIQSADPPVNGTTRTEFEYDCLDRRVRTVEKTHDGTDWTTQSNVTWLWCGDDICQQRDSTGSTPSRSYYAEGMMVGTMPYLQTTDHLGSVREVLDGSTGALLARYDYDPWGTRTKLAGSGVDSDFSFTGHLLHTVSGLILAKHRAYSASLGRWISADPIGEEDDLNLYRYVGGSPTMDFDPLGLFGVRDALGFVPVIGSALDAYDAARCGNYWTAAFHGVLAIADLGGIGAGAKLIGKALFKKSLKHVKHFKGLEVRAVRDLGHIDSGTLKAMSKHGFAPKTINGDSIVLHHHRQNPGGFIVEMPSKNHRISNINQHPFGNAKGKGLTPAQRQSFNEWRKDYWKSRANDELNRRKNL